VSERKAYQDVVAVDGLELQVWRELQLAASASADVQPG